VKLTITSNERRLAISNPTVPPQQRVSLALCGRCRHYPLIDRVETRRPWESLASAVSSPLLPLRALLDCAQRLQTEHTTASVSLPASITCAVYGSQSAVRRACLLGPLALARLRAPRSLPLLSTHKASLFGTDAPARKQPEFNPQLVVAGSELPLSTNINRIPLQGAHPASTSSATLEILCVCILRDLAEPGSKAVIHYHLCSALVWRAVIHIIQLPTAKARRRTTGSVQTTSSQELDLHRNSRQASRVPWAHCCFTLYQCTTTRTHRRTITNKV
jgi:hypothetical protein